MKQNLAKVLGMEEHIQRTQSLPSEEQLLQQSQTEMEQYLEDHQQATEVALEAIGNAQALAGVIACNDSTDKTTYELLKVAVEQLKEKTGVFTQSTALESIDKYSYKAEALQDVKEFIKKVWEAIKKAFFAMVDKVKAFFKARFSFGKKVEEKVHHMEEEIQQFEENLQKQGEEVIKDVTEATKADMDGINEFFKKATAEMSKPVEIPEFQDTYSEKIKKFIGLPMKNKSNSTRMDDVLLGAIDSVKYVYIEVNGTYDGRMGEPPTMDKNGVSHRQPGWDDLKDNVLLNRKLKTGIYGAKLSVKDKKVELEIGEDSQIELWLGYVNVGTLKKYILPHSLELIELANESDKQVISFLDKIPKDLNMPDHFDQAEMDDWKRKFVEEQFSDYKNYFSVYREYIQSCAAAVSKLSNFALQMANAVADYVNETIEITKSIATTIIKVNGHIEKVDKQA